MDYSQLSQLVTRAQSGDNKALSELCNETYQPMYFFVLKTIGNEQDALDALQNAYIIMVEKIGTLKDTTAFIAWFKRILINECNQVLRKKGKYVLPDDEDQSVLDFAEDDNEEFLPESVLNDSETKHIIFDTIENELSQAQKQTVLMFYYDELKISQIAEAMETNENTVKNRLHESRKKLKNALLVYRKQGLLVVVPLPLLTQLLRQLAEETKMSPQAAEALMQGITEATGISITLGAGVAATQAGAVSASSSAAGASTATSTVAAGTAEATATVGLAAKIAAMSIATKIIAGIVSFVLIVAGIFGINSLLQRSESSSVEQTISPAAELILSGETRNIPFGGYTWRVLTQENGKALLISENIIDLRAYNDGDVPITWEDCSLRSYLNGEFFDSFGEDEQSQIIETLNINEYIPLTGTPTTDARRENDTYDKVFLLSVDEAEKYFTDNNDRTAKLKLSGEQIEDATQRMTNNPELSGWEQIINRTNEANGEWYWWLRSSGGTDALAPCVHANESYNAHLVFIADTMENGWNGVRPAMWINLPETISMDDVTETEQSSLPSVEDILVGYLNDVLVPQIGVTTLGEYGYSSNRLTSPLTGITSVAFADLDKSGAKKMIVVLFENQTIKLNIYHVENGGVSLADSKEVFGSISDMLTKGYQNIACNVFLIGEDYIGVESKSTFNGREPSLLIYTYKNSKLDFALDLSGSEGYVNWIKGDGEILFSYNPDGGSVRKYPSLSAAYIAKVKPFGLTGTWVTEDTYFSRDNLKPISQREPNCVDIMSLTTGELGTGKAVITDYTSWTSIDASVKISNTESGAAELLSFKNPDGTSILTEGHVKSASVTSAPATDGRPAQYYVNLTLTAEGRKKFAEATERLIGQQIPIYLNGRQISAPTIKDKIDSDMCVITMGSLAEAQALADEIITRLRH